MVSIIINFVQLRQFFVVYNTISFSKQLLPPPFTLSFRPALGTTEERKFGGQKNAKAAPCCGSGLAVCFMCD